MVENAPAAELATNVRAGGGPAPAEEKLELASNHDFDHSQLTGTGSSWTDDRNAIAIGGEEGVIRGTVLEEEPPAEEHSWGVAVSQSSPASSLRPRPPRSPRRLRLVRSPCRR